MPYVISKIAGFVYESFQIDMYQVFSYFWPYNRMHDTNLLKTGLQIKSAKQNFKVWTLESGFVRIQDLQIRIFKDLCCAIALFTIQNKSF